MSRVHAFGDDALGDLDAVGLVAAIQEGEVSIPEVVEAAISRTERLQPELNAVAYVAFDRARAEARDPRGGFFAGVPTFVKDNVDVASMPTQQGCDAFRGRPLAADGDFARMYLATGLVPLGKTQLSEFGFSPSPSTRGSARCGRPWDTTRTAGASSAGSAALVAAGAVPIAHANDGGGSIRIPAAVNGLVGLKPTRDRLAQDKLSRQMPVRIIADGVVTRSVRDTAAFLREAESVYRELRLPPIGDVTRPGPQAAPDRRPHRRARPGVRRRRSPSSPSRPRSCSRSSATRSRRSAHPAPAYVARRLPPLLGDARDGDRPHRAPRGRPDLGPRPARQPHPRARPARAPQPAPAPGSDPSAAPAPGGLRGLPPRRTTSC